MTFKLKIVPTELVSVETLKSSASYQQEQLKKLSTRDRSISSSKLILDMERVQSGGILQG